MRTLLPRHVGEQRRRLQQVDAEPHARDSGCCARSTRALRDRAKLGRWRRSAAPSRRRSLSVASPRIVTTGVGQPLELAGQELRRRPLALRADSGRCRRRARAAPSGGRRGRAPRSRASASSCPCRRSSRLIARLVPISAGNEPVGRRDHARGDVELVAVGLGIEVEGDAVAAVVRSAPASSTSARPEWTSALPRHAVRCAACRRPAGRRRAGRSEARRRGCRSREGSAPCFVLGLSLGRRISVTRSAVRLSMLELVVEPRAGRPVELDVGRGQEHAAAVGDRDVPQLRLAEDRAVDPADADAQARGGLEPAELVDDEAVAGRAVEQDEQRRRGGTAARRTARTAR